MELRHLRYFVAVAEEGSFTQAAEKRLHTAQPSLSRQLRDLEQEVGTPLFTRGAKQVEEIAFLTGGRGLQARLHDLVHEPHPAAMELRATKVSR